MLAICEDEDYNVFFFGKNVKILLPIFNFWQKYKDYKKQIKEK